MKKTGGREEAEEWEEVEGKRRGSERSRGK